MARRYEVTGPDGRRYVIEAPDDTPQDELERLARNAAGVGDNYPVVERHPELSAEARRIYEGTNKTSGKGGYRDLINQGVTFGLSDELAGLVNMAMHPLTSGAYAAQRDAERARIADVREEKGWAGTASELGGGLLTGAPIRTGAQALLNLGQAAKQGVKLGALGGGIGGFGSGDGAVDSLIKAGFGATFGATLGAAVPTLANLVANRVSGVNRILGRDTEGLSRQIAGEAIGQDGNTPAMIANRLSAAAERGVPMSIADTGENARGLLAAVSRRPGPARSLTRNVVDARQMEQSDRVLGAIGDNLGPIRGMRQQSDELMQQARTAAAPLYDEAYQTPVISTPELDALLNTPAGRGALSRARTIAANERRDPQALGFALDEDGNVRLDPTLHLNEDGTISQEVTRQRGYTPQTLDYVKRGLDDTIEQFRDPVTRRLNLDEAGRAINGVRSQLLTEIDRLNPAYGQARAAYAGPAAAEEAMQLGRRMLNASAEDIEAATARMGDFEREQFSLGVRAALADTAGRATDGASQAQRLLGTPRKRQALASTFGGQEGFDRFLATLADERATTDTYRSVMSGSQTAERLAADAQASDAGLLESASGAALRGVGEPVSLLGDALKSLGEVGRFGAGEAGDRTRESVASLLTETSPDVLHELSRAIKAARVQQALRRRQINRVTGRVGGGVGNTVGQLTGAAGSPE